MRPSWASLGVASIWMVCTGCPGREGLATSLPLVRDSAGITIVENRAPGWSEEERWCLGSVVTSVGEADGDPVYQLFRVLDATRLSDGTVVVGNSGSGELRFYDQSGAFVRTVGSVDGGPGEFKGVNALRAVRRLRGDTVFTWDLFAQSGSLFAPDGSFIRSFRLDGPARMQFFEGVFADGSLLMMAYDYTADGRGDGIVEGLTRETMDLFRYGSDHALTDTRTGVHGDDRFQAKWGPSGMITINPPFGRVSTVATSASRTYVATGDDDEVAVYDRLSTPELLIRRLGTTRPLTSEMIARDRAGRIEGDSTIQADERISARGRRLFASMPYPEVVPPYGRILVDRDANLWVEAYREEDGDSVGWSVFDEEGTWLGQVLLPPGFRVMEVGSEFLLGRSVDELGVERVVVYDLRKGAGCAP